MNETAFGYSDKLPERIRDVFVWLCQDLTALQSKWDFFVELYASETNTELLSELALASFNMIREALINDIVMGIGRMTDPPFSGRDRSQANLTLGALVQLCAAMPALADLQGKSDHLLTVCEPIRKQRHKRIGHRDLKTTIAPMENPLPGITKRTVDEFMQGATEVLNSIFQQYDGGELYFHGGTQGGAESLLFWLKEGKSSADRVRERLLRDGN